MNQISSITCIVVAFFFLLIPANNAFTPSALPSPESICNATPRPAFCGIKELEPMDGCTLHDVARKSFEYSLFIIQHVFYPLVDRAFYRLWESSSCVPLENRMLYALESCEDLIRENKKLLFRTFEVIKCRDDLENPSEAQGMMNSLRSVVRNHETCFDALTGAAAASADAATACDIKLNLLSCLSIGSESFNATLVLFRLGWGHHHSAA